MDNVWNTNSLYELGRMVNEYELWDEQIKFGVYPASNTPKLWVDCSDFFMWACADGEDLLPSDIALIENAAKDLKTAEQYAECYAFDLWVCRKRQQSPMRTWMFSEKLSPSIRRLFESVAGSSDE